MDQNSRKKLTIFKLYIWREFHFKIFKFSYTSIANKKFSNFQISTDNQNQGILTCPRWYIQKSKTLQVYQLFVKKFHLEDHSGLRKAKGGSGKNEILCRPLKGSPIIACPFNGLSTHSGLLFVSNPESTAKSNFRTITKTLATPSTSPYTTESHYPLVTFQRKPNKRTADT